MENFIISPLIMVVSLLIIAIIDVAVLISFFRKKMLWSTKKLAKFRFGLVCQFFVSLELILLYSADKSSLNMFIYSFGGMLLMLFGTIIYTYIEEKNEKYLKLNSKHMCEVKKLYEVDDYSYFDGVIEFEGGWKKIVTVPNIYAGLTVGKKTEVILRHIPQYCKFRHIFSTVVTQKVRAVTPTESYLIDFLSV